MLVLMFVLSLCLYEILYNQQKSQHVDMMVLLLVVVVLKRTNTHK